ncbi:hypothetical protein CHOCRA_000065 [Candidatus Hodgkinia cicadicola]|nr:hypothetical protein CHOCRA_000065 [Candidatus Hodgkinia cicadicola]
MNVMEPNQVLNIRLSNLVAKPAEGDKINNGLIRSTSTQKYNQGWAKATRSGNIVIGTIDLASSCDLIESVEFEINLESNNVIIKLLADKIKTHWTNISYFTKGNKVEDYIWQTRQLNEVTLNRTAYLSDVAVWKAEVTRDELFRILSSKIFCIKLEDKTITIVEFETYEISKLLKTQNNFSPAASLEQLDLQQNLKYNLEHKAKYYLQHPNIRDNLAEQYEEMKRKIVNEINLPRLLDANDNMPKWKNYYN